MNSNISLNELAQKTLELSEKLQQASPLEIEKMFFDEEEEPLSVPENGVPFEIIPQGPGLIYRVVKEGQAFFLQGMAFQDLRESMGDISRGREDLTQFFNLEVVEDLNSLIYYPCPSFRVALDLEGHFCSPECCFLYDPESFIYFGGSSEEILFAKGSHYKHPDLNDYQLSIWAPQNLESDTFNMLKDHFQDLKLSGILDQFNLHEEIIKISATENSPEIYQDLIKIFKEGELDEDAAILEGSQRLILWENFQYFAQIKNFWSFNLKEGFI